MDGKAVDQAVFAPWLTRWGLTADGAAIRGPNSSLLPVRRDAQLLMLKAAMQPREVRAGAYLQWLGGDGAPRVLAREADAMLMERVVGERSLVAMEAAGDARAALQILADTAAALHGRMGEPPGGVTPLPAWFERLQTAGRAEGGLLGQAAALATSLVADPRDVAVLHGDLHHWNVLDGGERGWVAIDPNALVGERGFEFALMVLPAHGGGDDTPAILRSRAALVGELAGVEPARLLAWVSVQAALWAAWSAPGRDWRAITAAAQWALT